MKLLSAVISVLAIIYLHSSLAATRKPKIKVAPKEKPINWNLSYYSEPFGLCKPLRILNPVEQARAHGFAVDIFRKCGPKYVIPYAQLYKVPAFAIEKAADVFCFLFSFAAYCDVTVDACADELLRHLQAFCEAWRISNFTVKTTFRNETFFITGEMCHGYIYDTVQCGIKKVGLRVMDYAKHTVLHFKKMLL